MGYNLQKKNTEEFVKVSPGYLYFDVDGHKILLNIKK